MELRISNLIFSYLGRDDKLIDLSARAVESVARRTASNLSRDTFRGRIRRSRVPSANNRWPNDDNSHFRFSALNSNFNSSLFLPFVELTCTCTGYRTETRRSD